MRNGARVRVGTALVQFALDWAQQNAIERVQLAVVSADTPAGRPV